MSESAHEPVCIIPPPPADRSPAAPLLLWLVIQLLALSLAVFRVPLSARFPPPGEQFAIQILLVTQIVASAMLFPFLMRDVKTTAMVVLAIAPFLQLGSYLSSVPTTRAALAGLYVGIWLITLALWRGIVQSRRGELLGVACALAISIGGAIFWYVRAESGGAGALDGPRDGLFGPILGAFAQLHTAPTLSWAAAMVLLVLSAAVFVTARMRRVGRSGESSPGS